MVKNIDFLNKTTQLAKSQSKIGHFIQFFNISAHFGNIGPYNKYNDRSSYMNGNYGKSIELSHNLEERLHSELYDFTVVHDVLASLFFLLRT